MPKLEVVNIKPDFLNRNVNEGFSGGEKKRNEILQLAVCTWHLDNLQFLSEVRQTSADKIFGGFDLGLYNIIEKILVIHVILR